MNACEITASITAIANIIAANVSEDELEVLGVVFTQLGDTLTTISVVQSICDKSQNKEKEARDTEKEDDMSEKCE